MFTVCPKCALTLVVTAADLRIAQGYVRCGRCLNVFNALTRLSEERPSAEPEPAARSPGESAAAAPEPSPAATSLEETGEIEVELDASVLVTAAGDGGEPTESPLTEESLPPAQLEPETAAVSATPADTAEGAAVEPTAVSDVAEPAAEDGAAERAAAVIGEAAARASTAEEAAAEPSAAAETAAEGLAQPAMTEAAPAADEEEESPGEPLAAPAPIPAASAAAAAIESPSTATTSDDTSSADSVAAVDAPVPASPSAAPEAPDAEHANAPAPQQPESTFELQARRPRAGLAWQLGAGVLAIALVLQVINHDRDVLAADPALRGPLTAVYSSLGVTLSPRWNIHAYDVHQLGASVAGSAAGEIVVRASVENSASRAQPLPLLRVTLQDRFGNRIAARDVPPGDYLPSRVKPDSLLAAGSRVDATMVFVDPGPQAVGFEIDACLRQRSGEVACAHGP